MCWLDMGVAAVVMGIAKDIQPTASVMLFVIYSEIVAQMCTKVASRKVRTTWANIHNK